MKSTLKIKNFGPVENATLNLRNVNVLIGGQATGKSTIAKLYTICKSPVMYHEIDNDDFLNRFFFTIGNKKKKGSVSLAKFHSSLRDFSIRDFLKSNTYIEFTSPTHDFWIKNNKIGFRDKIFLDKLRIAVEDENISDALAEIKKLEKIIFNFGNTFSYVLYEKFRNSDDSNDKGFVDFLKKERKSLDKSINLEEIKTAFALSKYYKSLIYNNRALYIPAERNIVSLIKRASLNFRNENIPIPKHLLDYAAKYETASEKIKSLDLNFLKKGTKYRNVNGEDKIYYSDRKSLILSESASGFQSVVPMIIPILSERDGKNRFTHFSFVIEELETNLFPKAQYDVLKFIEKDRYDDAIGTIDTGNIHTYTTHSPYVLSSLNNMLFAFNRGNNALPKVKKEINKIIEFKNWINPEHFSAYEIKNGTAKEIINRRTGLINENVIDDVSDYIINDFRKIAQISLND